MSTNYNLQILLLKNFIGKKIRKKALLKNLIVQNIIQKLCINDGIAGAFDWLYFTQISFENVTQEKIPNPTYSRRSPPSSLSNLTRTLIIIINRRK